MTPQARAQFDRGRRAFEARDYASAAAAFREGYRIDAHPDFLYTLGQAERLGGNCRAAIEAYRTFLESKPPPAEAQRTEANIRRCQEVTAKEPAPAAPPPPTPPATAQGAPPPASPSAPPTMRPPPVAGPRRELPERPSAAQSPWYLDGVGDAFAGTGIVGIGIGGTLLVLANTTASDANQARTLDAYVDDGDRAHDLRIAGVVCAAAGGALLIAGLVRYATRPTAAAAPRAARAR